MKILVMVKTWEFQIFLKCYRQHLHMPHLQELAKAFREFKYK